jgi:hypothetical protein
MAWWAIAGSGSLLLVFVTSSCFQKQEYMASLQMCKLESRLVVASLYEPTS